MADSAQQIGFQQIGLGGILRGYRLTVPPHQREYSWTGEEVTGSIGPDERNQHPLDGVVKGNSVLLTTHPGPGRTVAFAKCSLTVDGEKMTGTTEGGDLGDKATSIEFVRMPQ